MIDTLGTLPSSPWMMDQFSIEHECGRPGQRAAHLTTDPTQSDSPPTGSIGFGEVTKVHLFSEFAGADQQAILGPSGTRADTMIAVSATHLVQTTEKNISFFTKAGSLTFRNLLNNADPTPGVTGFFETMGAGPNLFDPKVVFDPFTERFFVVAVEATGGQFGQSFIYLGVSDDSDPNGTWLLFRTDTTGNTNILCQSSPPVISPVTTFLDFPGLSIDSQAVYVVGNVFSNRFTPCPNFPNTPVFRGTRIRIFDKADLLNGFANFADIDQIEGANDPSSMQPAQQVDHPEQPAPFTYLVNVFTTTSFQIARILDPLGPTPTYDVRVVGVPAFAPPGGGVPQSGGGLVNPFDGRILNAVWKGARLYCTHAVSTAPGKVVARWYEFNVASSFPVLVQSGDVDFGSDISTLYPAISVSDLDPALFGPNLTQVGMVFARTSAAEFPSIWVTARKSNDPAGVMGTPKLLEASVSPWGFPAGLYFGIGTDASGSDPRFWCVGEWASASNHWETRVGQFRVKNQFSSGAP